jgi:hypothetical protein
MLALKKLPKVDLIELVGLIKKEKKMLIPQFVECEKKIVNLWRQV